jgi:hypothetical protein
MVVVHHNKPQEPDMADISHIQAKVYPQTEKRRNGRVVREAGWIVCDAPTGKTLSSTGIAYPTEQAAQDMIPALLRQLSNQLDLAAQREATTTTALAAIEPSHTDATWTDLAKRARKKGIHFANVGVWLPTPDDANGGCYYCGATNCTECGTD